MGTSLNSPGLSPIMGSAPTPYFFYDNVTVPTPSTCGNGVCDAPENCLSCPNDCISGTVGGFDCGNGVCEDGETCYTCPDDCNADLADKSEPYCCYGGPNNPGVPFAVSCEKGDYLCGTGKGKCSSNASPIVSYCCGDGLCNGLETDLNCPIDNCASQCGNGVCDTEEGENANSCPLDCTCGNYVCDYDLGENVSNCDHDCGCNANYMCDPWEDADNCPMDNCYDDSSDESSDEGNCLENGLTCEGHGQCCSFACDEVCVG